MCIYINGEQRNKQITKSEKQSLYKQKVRNKTANTGNKDMKPYKTTNNGKGIIKSKNVNIAIAVKR